MSVARPRSTPCSALVDLTERGGAAKPLPASMSAHSSTTRDDVALREGASVVVFEDRKVLLVRRKHPPFAGLWSLPGGKLAPGETPKEAVCRELGEETGIEARILGVVDRKRVVPTGTGPGYRLTVFYGELSGGAVRAGGDAQSAGWVAMRDLEVLPMTPGTAELIWRAAHRVRRAG